MEKRKDKRTALELSHQLFLKENTKVIEWATEVRNNWHKLFGRRVW